MPPNKWWHVPAVMHSNLRQAAFFESTNSLKNERNDKNSSYQRQDSKVERRVVHGTVAGFGVSRQYEVACSGRARQYRRVFPQSLHEERTHAHPPG
jgi:hypothetical protein